MSANSFYGFCVGCGLTEYYVKRANKGEEYEENQYFYHPDHLGSSSFITNAIGYAEQLPIAIGVQYLPFGESFIDQRNGYSSRYTFSGKEKDDETQYSYFGARYYDSDLSVWLSVDPASDQRSWISPYNYVQWNPVGRVDPTGALDEVIITGPDADAAVDELNISTTLDITRDSETGKLTANGAPSTPAEELLLESINSEEVVTVLETKSYARFDSKDGSKNIWLSPAGFEGSETIDGEIVATQYINMEAAYNIAEIINENTGETIMHEINEAYAGGRDYPNCNYSEAYQQSHNTVSRYDRIKEVDLEWNIDTKSDPNYLILQGRTAGSSEAFKYVNKTLKNR